MRLLLGVTGSVAAVLAPKLIDRLINAGHEVKIIVTKNIHKFVSIRGDVHEDHHEWASFEEIGDPILHIELRKWADAFLIAPCTMHTLAKITNGLCDNLLTNTARAWDFSKPFFIAPAANTCMWESPITKTQLQFAEDLGIKIIPPICKTLACGDTGVGAMADIEDILNTVGVNHDISN
jgi:phosphopantothenoylcysteine decarboxylase